MINSNGLNEAETPKSILIKYSPQFLIVGIILLFYIHNLWFDFTYIDDNLIVFDEYEKINSLFDIPSTFVNGYLYDNYYRPIVMTSFIIDTAIAGQSSMMYHLTNIILHIIVSLLLFKILTKIGFNDKVSLITTLIFAIHPLNTNAVSWIVGRNDLLLAVFAVGSLYFYLRYRETRSNFYFSLSLIAYFFAMLSKEAGILVPVIILLFEIIHNENKSIKWNRIYLLLYFFIPAIVYFCLRSFVASINVREEISFNSFIQNIYILFEYLAKTGYFLYIDPLPNKNTTLILIGSLLLVLLITYTILNRKDNRIRIFMFGFLMFLIIVLPTLFVRVNADDGEFNYIDCRMYLPLFGIMISYAVIIEKIFVSLSKPVIIVLGTSIFIYLSLFTFLNNQVYKSGLTYWSAAIEKNPQRATYWMGLGFYYFDNKMYDKAIHCAENAIRIKPENTEYYYKAALAFETTGDLIKANDVLERSINIDKDNPVTVVNLIKNYLKLGKKVKADVWLSKFLAIDLKSKREKADLTSALAYYYAQAKEFNIAIKFMKIAIDVFPDNAGYNNDLGVFYVKNGIPDSAKIYFEKAIAKDSININYKKNLKTINN
ncbi:MAG: tetratricopeptide repeat protein [Ignavibacteriota bacterium]|jgi:Tfp pilus assembly protein PilF|nr:MAG: tetratricopeptide repeat protein [Chlorobiota bacterium]MBE7475682.1 tetratricopeptide repeat protein [Ignavibacteriales bacterium]MBL1123009.1 tetratricopeptide repeat protein [Ignavibacteriota bacterium]MCC7093018.1 tetratricopeptide repeat protein [Ignavibacteriaceae bacterium]MCE7856058.1 tetratricopeptide repeat protein [Ignavibacteria bacterium CHB3]MEB2295117.1 tetratricopeptide repeat protein [Ignavibacteria bacterium]